MADLDDVTARRGDQVDDLHGELVADPYRWLEDTDSAETRAWIEAENARTEGWLAAVAAREPIRRRLTELWDHPRVSTPLRRAGRWFTWRNTGLQNQDVLYVTADLEEEGRVLLDPNVLSADGTVAVSQFEVSEDGSLLLYATSAAGSDWLTWRVRDVDTGHDRADVVEWAKYSNGAWLADGSGFFYGAVDPPRAGTEYLEAAGAHRILRHRLGTEQADDELVFAPTELDWMTSPRVADDGRCLVLTTTRGTAPETEIRVVDLTTPGAAPRLLVGGFTAKTTYVTSAGATFHLLTDDGAERGRIVAVELADDGPGGWREVVPESDALLLAAAGCGGRLVLHRLRDASSELTVCDLDGQRPEAIPVPELSSIGGPGEGGVEGHPSDPAIQYTVSSFVESGAVWQYDLSTGRARLLHPSSAAIDPAEYVSERVFVTADDGASIPLFLTHRRDVTPTGDVPVLLYGYGGFDIPLTPMFQVGFATWMERGGIYAQAALRGGGEYGRSWHEAGIHGAKQRVFDDFRDCARWLSDFGWTSPAHLAINGGSNGGLLVGASVNQHPELFGAAVAEVGVLDMLRFHRFTIGWAWKSDFGDPDDPEQYPWVRAYSPLHNVRTDRPYPPILLTTGDHDDRVIPGHTFKFAATLQAEATGGPVLVRIETAAGHGRGMPTEKAIALTTDILAFLEATVG